MAFVKIVLNKDLFTCKVPSLSGFHGESRILRYLFIRYCEKNSILALADLPKQWNEDFVVELQNLNKGFTDFYKDRLTFGSSQGACAWCAEYLTKLGVTFGSVQQTTKDRDDTWVHPLTMRTRGALPSVTSYLLGGTVRARNEIKIAENEKLMEVESV